MNQQVITIATGKKLYVDLAINLARSFLLWNKRTTIAFYIVTDLPEHIPLALRQQISVIEIEKGELGYGFSPKLHLDNLVPEGQSLFIDSDCLIFEDLSAIFKLFKGKAVSVVGGYISKGEWFGNIKAICTQFKVPHIPKFNGGIYYLEKGEIAKKVYTKARELEAQYEEIGFVNLRGRPNDEVIMALAMQLYQLKPVMDDGTIISDLQACPGSYHIDVVKGERSLINPSIPHPLHQNWYPFYKVEPSIVHFLGYYTQHYPYKREVYRLEKALSDKLNWKTELLAKFKIAYPAIIKNKFKKIFRPIFRLIFGTRKIAKSERAV